MTRSMPTRMYYGTTGISGQKKGWSRSGGVLTQGARVPAGMMDYLQAKRRGSWDTGLYLQRDARLGVLLPAMDSQGDRLRDGYDVHANDESRGQCQAPPAGDRAWGFQPPKQNPIGPPTFVESATCKPFDLLRVKLEMVLVRGIRAVPMGRIAERKLVLKFY